MHIASCIRTEGLGTMMTKSSRDNVNILFLPIKNATLVHRIKYSMLQE